MSGLHGHTLSLTSTTRNLVRPSLLILAHRPVRYVSSVSNRHAPICAVALVDDKSVPEAHRGLHQALYGDGGSEQHDLDSSYSVRKGEDEGLSVMPVSAYLDSRDGDKPLGVYCVYDHQHEPQYIGYSRNMVLAIKGHLARVGQERCAFVRAMVYGNKAMASRSNLERGVQNWIQELFDGRVPPANLDPGLRSLWEGTGGMQDASAPEGAPPLASPAVLDRRLMSPSELAAYEEKKLKLRKAMGEKMVEGRRVDGGVGSGEHHSHDGNEDEEVAEDPAVRRQKLMAAMNRGDWSAVIHAQTQETIDDGAAGQSDAAVPDVATTSGGSAQETSEAGSSGAEEAASGGVVSPFAKDADAAAAAEAAGGDGRRRAAGLPPLTVEAVEAALEEVRPYLMADGGDVEVVDVADGIVYLRLQGACSSCPSQSATMKGGIERVIKQTFGDQVRDILQLDKADPGASVERVDAALNMLRGAIYNFGGSVEVLSVEDGVCTIRYRGPPAIGKGVQGAIKDSFADLREVRLVD